MPPKPGTDGEIPVSEYVARFPPAVQRIIREARKTVKTVAPRGDERAYRGWPIRMRTERGLIAIAGFADHVNINFWRGTSLADPKGLLEGSGKSMRHVKLRSVEEARRPEVRALVEQELASGPRKARVSPAVIERVTARVRRICLALPETTEKLSHGAPTWFWRDKRQFAQVWSYHHDDGRFAMWCAAPTGAQSALVKADPTTFFVPPYVGHRGWLGVRLDMPKPDWDEIEHVLHDAHAEIAGKR